MEEQGIRQKVNAISGFIWFIMVCVALAIGVIIGDWVKEREIMKASLIAPTAQWTELYGDSLTARQVWNSAAMANDLKRLQAEQKNVKTDQKKMERKIDKKADK